MLANLVLPSGATGGEAVFDAMRPVILNGIPSLATRPDLADRAIVLTLPQISDGQRKPETEFWAEFDAASGRLLGALLDAVSVALKGIGTKRRDSPLAGIPVPDNGAAPPGNQPYWRYEVSLP